MNLTGFSALLRREIKRFMSMPTQTILPPLVTAVLYIIIFGAFIGGEVGFVDGVPYMVFFIPGLIMLDVILSSYSNAAFTLFFSRFLNIIGDVLISPLSYIEMVAALILGSVARGMLVGFIILFGSLFFVQISIHSIPLLLFFMFLAAMIFSLIGLLVGLFAKEFEHLEILSTFLITPLAFLGGVFNSVSMLPESLRFVAYYNPFFYIINGFRYAMIGITEADLLISIAILVIMSVSLLAVTVKLFSKGYKLRT